MNVRRFVRGHPALSFFGLTIGWSYLFLHFLFAISPPNPAEGPKPVQLLLAAVGSSPSLFGILLAYLANGRPGLRELFIPPGSRRVGAGWGAMALLLFPLLAGVTYLLYSQLGGKAYPLTLANLATGITFGTLSSLFEEFGWRGFALPALQRRFSPLVSSLIVGLGWGLWHVRLNVTMTGEWSAVAVLAQVFSAWGPFSLTAISLLMTWVYNDARGGMWPMVLLHFGLTSSFFLFGPPASASSAEFLRFHLIALGAQWTAVAVAVALGRDKWLARTPPALGGVH